MVEGVEKLCNDLKVDPTDIVMLVLSYRLGSTRMCELTRRGWMEGWTHLK
jgi:DCN1-like protein 1/2